MALHLSLPIGQPLRLPMSIQDTLVHKVQIKVFFSGSQLTMDTNFIIESLLKCLCHKENKDRLNSGIHELF